MSSSVRSCGRVRSAPLLHRRDRHVVDEVRVEGPTIVDGGGQLVRDECRLRGPTVRRLCSRTNAAVAARAERDTAGSRSVTTTRGSLLRGGPKSSDVLPAEDPNTPSLLHGKVRLPPRARRHRSPCWRGRGSRPLSLAATTNAFESAIPGTPRVDGNDDGERACRALEEVGFAAGGLTS